jgi:two-component system sensor histidine kinase KdpD
MARLIDNLLDMIRLESGALEVQKDWQTLEEPVGGALLRLGDRLRDHPTEVRLPPDLPLVPLDPILIEPVMMNLLENAIRYTPPGTAIEISAAAEAGGVRVTVADRGPGLVPGEEERIFEKFYRGTHERVAGGIGLGLAICRGILTAHGGRIWAGNRPGGGAAFHFTLPISGSPPVVAEAEAQAGRA